MISPIQGFFWESPLTLLQMLSTKALDSLRFFEEKPWNWPKLRDDQPKYDACAGDSENRSYRKEKTLRMGFDRILWNRQYRSDSRTANKSGSTTREEELTIRNRHSLSMEKILSALTDVLEPDSQALIYFVENLSLLH